MFTLSSPATWLGVDDVAVIAAGLIRLVTLSLIRRTNPRRDGLVSSGAESSASSAKVTDSSYSDSSDVEGSPPLLGPFSSAIGSTEAVATYAV